MATGKNTQRTAKLVQIGTLCLLASTSFADRRRVNTSSGTSIPTSADFKSEIKTMRASQSIPPAWQDYLNPQTSEFWTEGNHTPDAGFVLFLQDMTVESAKLWMLRGEIKAKYLERALAVTEQAQRELLEAGLIKDRYNVLPNRVSNLLAPSSTPKVTVAKARKKLQKDLAMYFIFSPTCPHCQAMAKTLRGFPNVYPQQAVGQKLYHWPGLEKSQRATAETLREYASKGQVPVLVLHNTKSNKVIVLEGRQSAEQILLGASQLLGTEEKKK